jgi:acyl-CoA synthetase (AMP-forming)/AMP-acid ligase II
LIAGGATRAALRAAGERVLVSCGGRDWTGRELDAAIDVCAWRLSDIAGVVGLWAWNSAELLCAHLAAERAGLTRIAIDPEAPSAEAAAILRAAGVSVVLTDADHDAPDGFAVISLDSGLGAGASADPGALSGPGAGVGTSPGPRAVSGGSPGREVDGGDIALLISRGFAGGDGALLTIPLSFANWEAHMDLAAALFTDGTYGPAAAEPRFLTVQQLQYGTGLVGSFPFLRMGLPQVILRRFDAADVAEAVERHHITSTFMVPGMVTRLAAAYRADGRAEAELRILYGGAPFPAADLRSALDAFGPRLVQLYGRFEGGWPITVLGEREHERIAAGDQVLAGSCGRPVAGIDVALQPVPGGTVPGGTVPGGTVPGGAGTQLRVRSGCVSPSFRGPDGWCDLGDLARQDGDGYVYLEGRIDGMINTGSFHVYPAEVEAAVAAEFPAALTVKVSGRPDPKWGQAVVAELSWPAGAAVPDRAEFRRLMSARLAKYKIPTLVEHNLAEQPAHDGGKEHRH